VARAAAPGAGQRRRNRRPRPDGKRFTASAEPWWTTRARSGPPPRPSTCTSSGPRRCRAAKYPCLRG